MAGLVSLVQITGVNRTKVTEFNKIMGMLCASPHFNRIKLSISAVFCIVHSDTETP